MEYIVNSRSQRIAYIYSPASAAGEGFPVVMFLGGFRSDMEGTKALYLEEQCKARGQGFIRFDYTGHGSSGGLFEEGAIGAWRDDAKCVLDQVVRGNVVLVGSSMGGWISLLLLLERAERIAGVVGIAAAPDFTKEIEAQLTPEQMDIMMRDGRIEVPNDYSDEPYIFTRDLIEDGRKNSLLDGSYNINVPMVLVQGKMDDDVPWEKALRIQKAFDGPKTDVVFVDDGDHRLSKPDELEVIWQAVMSVSG
ncbi:MAG: alpha/beta hydrolase family protein [Alphaproteobacteria bacterium]